MAGETTAEERLAALGLVLPAPAAPGGNYLPARQAGSLLFLAGVISSNDSGVLSGTVGLDRSVEEGREAARCCALTQLSVIRRQLGTLDRVEQVITVNGYVNAVSGFPDSPKVINGASDLLVEVFGDAGRHARAAIGVAALPRHALVELQMVVAVR
ncbi:MAG TPA: RidA family protein [Acidobacteriaceae bacterium]|nr:RidA family protein [Acidobacteriaceae bacterium]